MREKIRGSGLRKNCYVFKSTLWVQGNCNKERRFEGFRVNKNPLADGKIVNVYESNWWVQGNFKKEEEVWEIQGKKKEKKLQVACIRVIGEFRVIKFYCREEGGGIQSG